MQTLPSQSNLIIDKKKKFPEKEVSVFKKAETSFFSDYIFISEAPEKQCAYNEAINDYIHDGVQGA